MNPRCRPRVVFDVTNGKAFYGPGGPYENFAGRDASRGLALNSFDPAVLTDLSEPIDTLTDLSLEEKESLDNWKSHFENKYKVVGSLHNPGRWTSRQYVRCRCVLCSSLIMKRLP
ncbi:hypothetical protein HF325_004113 [Metschnikowia pulcherrima]|uniref:Cytochrome b5 heme-binding domain-containing protein n=1 Tax=Metschnikowia pulcherrima TaxID=27326 RepID=A0A8H7GS76_9ASCO|nr:hypothetical protein HF325_004113 [Metschnikowia pulcherrima]